MLASLGLSFADNPLTAHVIGSRARANLLLDPQAIHYLDIQIGERVYTVEFPLGVARDLHCKKTLQVGQDYPVRVEKKKLRLTLPDGKACTERIEGVREPTARH